MTNPTTPFSWQMPTSTDLVTDLPADFEVFGQAVATSMADLLGGTTGQMLTKTTNTDMDFTWVTPQVGDITAVTAGTGISGGGTSGAVTITNSMATEIAAKGDLIAGTGSQTFDNVAVGTNGQVLTADSTTATGLAWSTVSLPTSYGYAAGKNKIINGDFNINQRSFTSLTCSLTDQYGFDRWLAVSNTGTVTYSTQAFTAGTAPVTGYESTNFARVVTTGQSGASAYAILSQKMESVRTFANQTITVSFWAKAASGTPKVAIEMSQSFGSGGSAQANTYAGQATISTSWTRYSVTVAVPSISGKTIGAGDHLAVNIWFASGTALDSRTGSIGIQTGTFDIWGVQAESGSTLTAFQTASGSLGGELALCQRYYWRTTATGQIALGVGTAEDANRGWIMIFNPVAMRVPPTSVDSSTVTVSDAYSYTVDVTSVTGITFGTTQGRVTFNTSGGQTTGRTTYGQTKSTGGYLGFSAEL